MYSYLSIFSPNIFILSLCLQKDPNSTLFTDNGEKFHIYMRSNAIIYSNIELRAFMYFLLIFINTFFTDCLQILYSQISDILSAIENIFHNGSKREWYKTSFYNRVDSAPQHALIHELTYQSDYNATITLTAIREWY